MQSVHIRNGSCGMSEKAIKNPFLRFGQFNNLRQMNAGASWSIKDSTELVNRRRPSQNLLSRDTADHQMWKIYANFDTQIPHHAYKHKIRQRFANEAKTVSKRFYDESMNRSFDSTSPERHQLQLATEFGEKPYFEKNRYHNVADRVCGKKLVFPPRAENIHQLKIEEQLFQTKQKAAAKFLKTTSFDKELEEPSPRSPAQTPRLEPLPFSPTREEPANHLLKSQERRVEIRGLGSFRRPKNKEEWRALIKRGAAFKRSRDRDIRARSKFTIKDDDEISYESFTTSAKGDKTISPTFQKLSEKIKSQTFNGKLAL